MNSVPLDTPSPNSDESDSPIDSDLPNVAENEAIPDAPADAQIPDLSKYEGVRNTPVPVTPIFTYALIAINVAIFFIFGNDSVLQGGNNAVAVTQVGQYYRLLTSMFLHADIMHVGLNMLALYTAGRLVEGYFGHTRFLLIYFLGGLCGSIASMALNESAIWSVGASGAIFAVFGAELVYYFRFGKVLGAEVKAKFGQSVGAVVLNLFYGFTSGPGIDNWAHLGGLIGGAALAFISSLLITVVRQPESEHGLILYNTRQRASRIFFGASAAIALLPLTSMVVYLLTSTITTDNITVTFPSGWGPGTPLGENPFCKEAGVDCLLSRTSVSLAVFGMFRYSGTDVAQSSLEQWIADLEAQVEQVGGEILSVSDGQLDGRDAVRSTVRLVDNSALLIHIRDGSSIVEIIVNVPTVDDTEFARYLSEIDPIIDSIDFAVG